ncbi:ferritin-like domain-containing protein [Ramlibacter tataouinensis]|uniref:DUF2383 domain-containing protein n=1 Tax=Ramlibacter tataouinensis (strain ATCC BAA-407 / DSM 14655 / LMG 21543 / TTB310) TaxID=365046 RepID=F5XXQ7_RAMTT|nr:PA2169 family four-helix-bundle protein [Ramlibacter tataouinensis]AEG91860.1 Conserved hypothetical protein [Ramlibacter tataouinensis TTB310]
MAADERDSNRDPITDEPGAHPVGTGVGATGGAVAGAAAGALGGPLGMAVGGVVGAVVGGLAGKAAAEAINPTAEEAYWRDNYDREPYYEQGRSFDDYGPAYRHGLTARTQYDSWDTAEPRLASDWDSARGGSSLSWPQAQPASRAAWNRVDTTMRSGSSGFSDVTGSGGVSAANSDGVTTDSSLDMGRDRSTGVPGSTGAGMGSGTGVGGVAAAVGAGQTAGNNSGDTADVIDTLQNLVECCKDGEYGFQSCAEQTQRQDLKSLFLQRADDCRKGAQQLNEQIRSLGGSAEDGGSTLGAIHRGWVSVKSTLTTYDDKAVLEEAERGEDNALARYRKALQKPLPAHIKQVVEHQMQGVQRNHDQIKMLRDQERMKS